MKEPVYRITVEVIDKGDEGIGISEELKRPIECSGFQIFAFQEDGVQSVLHHVNLYGLAKAIAKSDKMLAAAHLGKAMKEVEEMTSKSNVSSLLRALSGD